MKKSLLFAAQLAIVLLMMSCQSKSYPPIEFVGVTLDQPTEDFLRQIQAKGFEVNFTAENYRTDEFSQYTCRGEIGGFEDWIIRVVKFDPCKNVLRVSCILLPPAIESTEVLVWRNQTYDTLVETFKAKYGEPDGTWGDFSFNDESIGIMVDTQDPFFTYERGIPHITINYENYAEEDRIGEILEYRNKKEEIERREHAEREKDNI